MIVIIAAVSRYEQGLEGDTAKEKVPTIKPAVIILENNLFIFRVDFKIQ